MERRKPTWNFGGGGCFSSPLHSRKHSAGIDRTLYNPSLNALVAVEQTITGNKQTNIKKQMVSSSPLDSAEKFMDWHKFTEDQDRTNIINYSHKISVKFFIKLQKLYHFICRLEKIRIWLEQAYKCNSHYFWKDVIIMWFAFFCCLSVIYSSQWLLIACEFSCLLRSLFLLSHWLERSVSIGSPLWKKLSPPSTPSLQLTNLKAALSKYWTWSSG